MTTERLIASLKKNLGSDDARATKRLAIAEAYLQAGDKRSAMEWFLKAAAHAEFSEPFGAPLVYLSIGHGFDCHGLLPQPEGSCRGASTWGG